MEKDLTNEQFIMFLRDELHLGSICSVYNPDGIFESIEEKQQLLEWLYEKNRIYNK
jgi:hypothetical protein